MGYSAIQDLYLAGVRWELKETPSNNIARSVIDGPRPTRTHTTVVPPMSPVIPLSVETVRLMASRPKDIDTLSRMISGFNHPLKTGSTNTVLPHIAPSPNGLVVITDVPGSQDDISGQILSGPSGDLFDKMLSAIDMSRSQVSIIPIVFWRTPGGRTPTADELALARPFIDCGLKLLKPRLVITLGSLSAKEFGGCSLPKDHGQIFNMPDGVLLMPIYHPNYLLLKSGAKRDVWNALQDVQKMLKTE